MRNVFELSRVAFLLAPPYGGLLVKAPVVVYLARKERYIKSMMMMMM